MQTTFDASIIDAFKAALSCASRHNDKRAIAELKALCGRKVGTMSEREKQILRVWYMRSLEK